MTKEVVKEGFSDLQAKIYTREEHNISRRSIDPDALKIMYRLLRSGYQAYLVGGGVRDLLLNKPPKDFDIATDASPKQIRNLFRNSRIIGRRFKLAHIYFHGGKIIEVATFRDASPETEIKTDLDPAEVDDREVSEGEEEATQTPKSKFIRDDNIFGTASTDAIRRDLTINALFYDLSTFSIIDYVGGMQDLRAKVVRIIGDPDQRFAEDPVRLIRTVRHAARAGFEIEKTCLDSIIRNRELLQIKASMRIYEEVLKDLRSGYAFEILSGLAKASLLEFMLPELVQPQNLFCSTSSQFSEVLKQIDQLIRNKTEVAVTVTLAIFALFTNQPEQAEQTPITKALLRTRFESKQQIQQHLKTCFSKLAVPKRERERLEMLLAAWNDVVQTPLAEFKVKNIASRPYLSDLVQLLELTHDHDQCNLENLEKIEQLKQIATSKKKYSDQSAPREKYLTPRQPRRRHSRQHTAKQHDAKRHGAHPARGPRARIQPKF